MTYEEAIRKRNAAATLSRLEESGEITTGEQEILDNYRANKEQIVNEIVETEATYTGAKSEALFNIDDEIYGAYKAATDFIKNGDLQSAKEAYARHRDAVRKKNEMLEYAAPNEFAKGRIGGVAGTSTLGLGGTQIFNLARGASMAKQMLTGAGAGAAVSSAPEFGAGEGGFMNRVGNVSPTNTAIGVAAGGGGPVAGRAVEGGKRILDNIRQGGVDGYQGQAIRRIAGNVNNSEEAGIGVKEYLKSLGPEGMLADVPGGPQGQAAGLASMQGKGSTTLRKNILDRSKTAGARIETDFDELIDQPNAGFLASVANKQNKDTVISPMYEKAKASTKTFDVQDIREAILETSAEASRRSKAAMNELLADLGEDGNLSAKKLHNVRVELNNTKDQAFRAGDTGVGTNLGIFLDKIDDKLDAIDGYAVARSSWAEASTIDRAIEDGTKAFSGGKASAMSPKMMEAKLAKMTDAEREAFKAGAREYIGALMGTSRNDAAAAWAEFGKSWNAEKLEMIIGRTNAQQVTRRLMAESEFAKTKQLTLDNSQTEFRKDAKKSIGDLTDPTGDQPTVFQRTKRAMFDTPVNSLIDEILYSNQRGGLNRQIGEILTLQGVDRDRVVATILDEAGRMSDRTKADKILNALFSTAAGSAAVSKYVGNSNNGN